MSTSSNHAQRQLINAPATPLGAPLDEQKTRSEPFARVQGFVERRPWPAVGAAAGAGILVGALGARAPVAAAARSALATAFGIAVRVVLAAFMERVNEARRSDR